MTQGKYVRSGSILALVRDQLQYIKTELKDMKTEYKVHEECLERTVKGHQD